MILIAQVITFPPRERIAYLPIALVTSRAHISLLAIEHNIVVHLISPIRIVRPIAEFVDEFLIAMGEMRSRPGLANTTAPIEFHVIIQAAVFKARLKACVFVVDGLGAEVLSDEGGVQVGVVVVELEVVGFVVFGVVEVHAVAAVAEGAGEKVAIVGAGVLVGEASDFAGVGIFFGDLDGSDGGDEDGDEAEASEGELLRAIHSWGELLLAM